MVEQHLGRPLGPKEMVRHACDNPRCVAIDHLTPGSAKDNTRDAMERGRFRPDLWRQGDAEAKRVRAKELRTLGWTYKRIAEEVGLGIAYTRDLVVGRYRHSTRKTAPAPRGEATAVPGQSVVVEDRSGLRTAPSDPGWIAWLEARLGPLPRS